MAQGSGKIIFTCSLLTFHGGNYRFGIRGQQSGFEQFNQSLIQLVGSKRDKCKRYRTRLYCNRQYRSFKNDPDRSTSILSRIPAGCWGKAEDFEGLAVFLASKASDYPHGTILTANGGWAANLLQIKEACILN